MFGLLTLRGGVGDPVCTSGATGSKTFHSRSTYTQIIRLNFLDYIILGILIKFRELYKLRHLMTINSHDIYIPPIDISVCNTQITFRNTEVILSV